MKATFKKSLLLALALILLAGCAGAPLRMARAAVTYNNAVSCSISSSVNSNGKLSVLLVGNGIKGKTTRIGAELYVEKRILGIFWTRVSIGYTDNVWIDSVTGASFLNTFTTNLSSTGTYRVTVTFTFSGTGGPDDVIVKTSTATY